MTLEQHNVHNNIHKCDVYHFVLWTNTQAYCGSNITLYPTKEHSFIHKDLLQECFVETNTLAYYPDKVATYPGRTTSCMLP